MATALILEGIDAAEGLSDRDIESEMGKGEESNGVFSKWSWIKVFSAWRAVSVEIDGCGRVWASKSAIDYELASI
ncbi:hypothetical protein SDJN03_04878, partial [Cucurbita argyrosperma subsp. sororia]